MAKNNTTTAKAAADDAATTPRDRGCLPVLVTTSSRGVFFGWVAKSHNLAAENIRLEQARNCLYWQRTIGGFLGLAAVGPDSNCRIGATAPTLTLRGVTSVSECTPDAVRRWEAAPCVS